MIDSRGGAGASGGRLDAGVTMLVAIVVFSTPLVFFDFFHPVPGP